MTPKTSADPALPPVPLTVEGASVLHQMMRFKWPAWRALPVEERYEVVSEAERVLGALEKFEDGRQSAIFSMIGHKSDWMFVHFRKSFAELARLQHEIARLRLSDFLEPTHSYLSIIELGLYESSSDTYANLVGQGIKPFTEEWDKGIDAVLARHRNAMAPRLFPEIPGARYICFYPMDRKRGEAKNWYQEPMPDRQRMMKEHGAIGRRYAGTVKQIISGSIGFDDWEWGVDLFAEDPLVFKKLIYEMRFDEVSAVYALFGSFYVGLRISAAEIGPRLAIG